MVELSAGKDSRGGIQGVKEAETLRAHTDIILALQAMEFSVVPSMDSHF